MIVMWLYIVICMSYFVSLKITPPLPNFGSEKNFFMMAPKLLLKLNILPIDLFALKKGLP